MNTNDFYKELFEKYALDEDKIRIAALKQAKTPAWKRAVGTYWKTAAGVAAAVAVTVGAVTYTASSAPQDIEIKVAPLAALTAEERLHEAEMNYLNPPVDEERIDIYISFRAPLSYRDMAIAFSALDGCDDIEISAVYTVAGEVVREPELIKSFAEDSADDYIIAGVKINTPPSMYRDIHDLTPVGMAEIASAEMNDETFTPMPIGDTDPLNSDIDYLESETSASAPAVPADTTVITKISETSATTVKTTETSVSSAQTTEPEQTEAETSATDDTTVPAEETPAETSASETEETKPVSEEDEDPEPETAPDEAEPITQTSEQTSESAETSEPEATTTESSETEPQTVSQTEPHEEAVTETADASRAGLMTDYYSLNVENALETFMIGNNALVLTKSEVYIYPLGSVILNSTQPSVLTANSPKIAYANNRAVILTSCGMSGLRDQIIVFDPADGTICLTDLSASLEGAEIGVINYSPDENKYFIKAVTSSSTCVFEAQTGSQGYVTINKLFGFDGAVSLAGYKNGDLYFTARSDSLTDSLYMFNCHSGNMSVLSIFDKECRIKRSSSFRSFAVVTEDGAVSVFDVGTGSIIATELEGTNVSIFDGGRIYVRCDGAVYRLEGLTLTPSTEVNIAFEEKISANYEVVETSPQKIVVAGRNKDIW